MSGFGDWIDRRPIFSTLTILAASTLIIAVPLICVKWYQAGVQQKVWERQGCEMTQWETFIGSKPIIREFKEIK
jgi:hypothetical protein